MGENDYQGGHELTENQLYRLWMSNNLDMKALLCKVFSVDWAAAQAFFAQTTPDRRKPEAVGRYYQAFIKWFRPSRNWQCIVEWKSTVRKYLGDASLWKGMTAEEIIREIRNCPEECRRAVDFLLRKYRCACEAYLIDIAITSEWQLYFIERFQESRPLAPEEIPTWTGKIENEAFGFCCFLDEDTDVSIRILMERMFTIQKIQALLSDADGAAGLSEELNCPEEPEADRQEPEYLLKWAESTNGKKYGVWKELFMLQAFRDEVKAMANEQMKMTPVLTAYWNKHETLQGKGSFDSFRKGFGGYPKCRDLFPE